MTITINEREYRLKMTWGALYAFEQYPFTDMGGGMGEVYKGLCLTYCILNACNTDFMEFDAFMEFADDDKDFALDAVEKSAKLLEAWSSELAKVQKKRADKTKVKAKKS